jgi:hypothetical protein
VLDYDTKEYKIYNNLDNSDNLGDRIGTDSPIKWYEYVNP